MNRLGKLKYLVGKLPICNHKIGRFKHAINYETGIDSDVPAANRNIYQATCTKCGWTVGDIIRLTLRIVRLRQHGKRI